MYVCSHALELAWLAVLLEVAVSECAVSAGTPLCGPVCWHHEIPRLYLQAELLEDASHLVLRRLTPRRIPLASTSSLAPLVRWWGRVRECGRCGGALALCGRCRQCGRRGRWRCGWRSRQRRIREVVPLNLLLQVHLHLGRLVLLNLASAADADRDALTPVAVNPLSRVRFAGEHPGRLSVETGHWQIGRVSYLLCVCLASRGGQWCGAGRRDGGRVQRRAGGGRFRRRAAGRAAFSGLHLNTSTDSTCSRFGKQ